MLKLKTFSKLLVVSLIIFSTPLFFRKTEALIISPPLIDINIDRGQNYSGEFSVIFKQDDPQTLFLYVKKLDFEDDTNNQITTDAEIDEPTLANWVKLDNNVVTKPSSIGISNGDNVVSVKYTVDIPVDAPAGAHYAQILISQKTPDGIPLSNQVALGTEIGYQILVNLKGDRSYDTKLVSFKLKDGISIFPTLPVDFETIFKNDGNVYVTPSANIEVFASGNKIDNIELNIGRYRIFPGKTREYDNTWSEENIEEMTDNAKIEAARAALPKDFFGYVSYELSHFRIGIYSAELAGFAGAQPPFKATVNFVVIPYHLLILVASVLGLFLVVYKMGKRNSVKTQKARH
ncbi:MAG: hypothetical protein ABIM99_03670 [Candidatus Dojkabacteria bacterium]